jgi:hypothetical protein
MMIIREKPKNSEKDLLQCNFVHDESHLRSPDLNPGHRLRYGMASKHIYMCVCVCVCVCV